MAVSNNNTNTGTSAERKAELVGRMIELIFSDRPLPENELDDISLYLTEKVDAELLDTTLYSHFALRPQIDAKSDSDRGADYAERWKGLAEALGMDPDIERLNASWLSRAAAEPAKPVAAASRPVAKLSRRSVWSRVAAVLLPTVIALGGYFGWEALNSSNIAGGEIPVVAFVATKTVTAPADAIREITMVDGTRVTLNRNSTFSYNDNREGELSGEAYFRVAKDPTHPFVIHSDKLTVSVLGTEFDFNVATETSILSLYEGTVELEYATGTQRLDGRGHRFTLDHATMLAETGDFDADVVPEWMTREEEAQMKIMPLNDIFNLIETEYGVTISGREAVDLDRRYYFMLDRTASVEQVMQALQFAGEEFDYRTEGNTIIIGQKQQ